MNIKKTAQEYIEDLKTVLDQIDLDELEKASNLLLDTHSREGKVLVMGNGGSAATANHMASDLAKTVRGHKGGSKKPGFRAISLVDNISTITAWSNDVDYEVVLVEQVRTLGKKGDTLIAISSSGNSKNIIKAVEEASSLGLDVITISGFKDNSLSKLGHVNLVSNHNKYGPVEDIQLILNHILVSHFYNLFNSDG
jgi:D-sedoheptulose 7-phosphate isomerase